MGCNNSNQNTNKPSEESTLRIKSTPKEDIKTKIIEAKIVLLGEHQNKNNRGKNSFIRRCKCRQDINSITILQKFIQ